MKNIIYVILIVFPLLAYAQDDRQCIREGNRMYRQKDYAKAEVLYRKALAKKQDNPQANYNLGCALMMQQKDSAAVAQFQKAAKIESTKMRLSKVYHNIGVICQNHKMYGDAIKAYAQSLRCNPKDDETRYNLALCKKLQKDNPQQNKDDQKKNEDNDEQQNKQNQKQDKQEKKQQQQPQEQMSKDNAERLLDAAVQNEKATQQRLKQAMQRPQKRNLNKNW